MEIKRRAETMRKPKDITKLTEAERKNFYIQEITRLLKYARTEAVLSYLYQFTEKIIILWDNR